MLQFSFGSGLLLRAIVSLGFLGGLIAENLDSQAAKGRPLSVATGAAIGVSATSSFCGVAFTSSMTASDAARAILSDGGPLRRSSSESSLTTQLEIGLPDEFGIAVEDDDPIEMFRVDLERRLFGIDHFVIGPTVASHAARNIRSSISSPLLV